MTYTKTCTKCGATHPASVDFFYKHPTGRFGVTPRCKPCVNEDNKAAHNKRLMENPDHTRALANSRSKKSYQKDLEKNRERQRDFQAKKRACPETRAKINMAKRAGGARLSQEDFDHLFSSQGCICAICGSDQPGAKHGWNIDHCHKTNKVRFILCAHCNRGLGAFQDNPETMRKAADLLQAFYEKG